MTYIQGVQPDDCCTYTFHIYIVKRLPHHIYTSIITQLPLCVCVCVMSGHFRSTVFFFIQPKMSKIYFLSELQVNNTVLLTIVTALYIRSLELTL